eukprot:2510690-Amphidinium_carterae.4
MAKGYTQKVNLDEIYAATPASITLRMLLTLAQPPECDSCVYYDNDITVMVYVDHLLLIGEDGKVKNQEIPERIGDTTTAEARNEATSRSSTTSLNLFLGRQVEYYGRHIALSMTKDY